MAGDSLVLQNRHTGERLEFRRFVKEGRRCLQLHGSLPARRQGPPLHIHCVEAEKVHVLAGQLTAVVDGTQIQIGPGGSGTFPAGSVHRWWNDGDETLVIEGVVEPLADFDCYLQAVFEVVNAGPPDRPPLFYMAHVVSRHRRTQAALIMPRAAQTIVLPLVIAIGTLLGKYRGTDWPGCPARCTGAPAPARTADAP